MQAVEVAAVQLRSTPDGAASVQRARELCAKALEQGAGLVVLPEGYAGISEPGTPPPLVVEATKPGASDAIAPFAALSAAHPDAVIVLGGVPERHRPDPDPRHFNTAFVLHAGRVAARYRKAHLFCLRREGVPTLREADAVRPGDELVVIRGPDANLGLSICYDLRFPWLYEALCAAGAEILLVPSAFTAMTGAAHWRVLLRARAIETRSFVLAPAQWGSHCPQRESWGHSLIVDPWGRVLGDGGAEHDGIVTAHLDSSALREARARLPLPDPVPTPQETSTRAVSLGEGETR